MLSQQEQMLRKYYPALINVLPEWASQLASDITTSYPLLKPTRIILAGKSLSAEQNSIYAEADIILADADGREIPISIKLSKGSSFVNTKSAGVRSFFTKYFLHPNIENIQTDFNDFIDKEYENFALQMHLEAGIEYTCGFNNWEKEGLEVLPGQLSLNYREFLLGYYEKVTHKMAEILKEIDNESTQNFTDSLYPLMGFSSKDIIQATLFYSGRNDEVKFSKTIIADFNSLAFKRSKSQSLKINKTNLEIIVNEKIIQLRLKPMNKFTSKAFKINCSVKY